MNIPFQGGTLVRTCTPSTHHTHHPNQHYPANKSILANISLSQLTNSIVRHHPIIGIVVLAALFFQPIREDSSTMYATKLNAARSGRTFTFGTAASRSRSVSSMKWPGPVSGRRRDPDQDRVRCDPSGPLCEMVWMMSSPCSASYGAGGETRRRRDSWLSWFSWLKPAKEAGGR